jgi:hypothetical protein
MTQEGTQVSGVHPGTRRRDAHRFSATSSGRRHPCPGAVEDEGLGVPPAGVDWPGDAEAVAGSVLAGDPVDDPVDDVVEGVVDGPLKPGVPVGVGDEVAGVGEEVAGVGELGASCVHAAMTTRSLAGSALPPRPLRSTK